ncbi:hypothetical protein MTR67_035936 [Solanum verrucosum]|uniref:Uncharacterized protein n=1 Tax=Solanum verrucosum TaxID=315347 RepID=A0AAF0UBL1_SOLVR|nr:hypothetical protein MTR67_035936 [Solanum verrucosum]
MVYSSSSIRAFGSLLCRISNGVYLKPHHSFTLRSVFLLSGSFSSSSWYSSSDIKVLPLELQSSNSVRKIWTSSPLCMGRRSCKIAGRKTAQDLKKAKLYSKIGKEIVSAVKKGGPSPISNTALAALIEKVKELDIPKDIVDRNVKRASEKGQEAFIEKIYEVYGYGGVGIIIEVLTDKVNRSVAAVREVVKDNGGKMADPGSIMFKFQRARVANVKVTDVDRDQLLTIALDAGAEDIIEPSMDEYDTEADSSESEYVSLVGYCSLVSCNWTQSLLLCAENKLQQPVTAIAKSTAALILAHLRYFNCNFTVADEFFSSAKPHPKTFSSHGPIVVFPFPHGVYKVVSSAENYPDILSKLQEEGIKFKPDNGSELLPTTPIEVDDEAMELNKELMSKLLELDDVDAVYTDQKY